MTCTETDWAELDAVEARREYDERNAPVATLGDVHAHWHLIHGRDNIACPLDCGVGEGFDDEPADPAENAAYRAALFFSYAADARIDAARPADTDPWSAVPF